MTEPKESVPPIDEARLRQARAERLLRRVAAMDPFHCRAKDDGSGLVYLCMFCGAEYAWRSPFRHAKDCLWVACREHEASAKEVQ